MMHICFLTLDFPPFRSSGLTVYSEGVVQDLAARGHEVTVIAAARPEASRVESAHLPENVQVLRVPVGRADWIGFGWQAAKYLHAHAPEYDVIHFADVHFAYAFRGAFTSSAFQSFRQRLTSHHGRPYYTSRQNLWFRLAYYNTARWLMEAPSVRRAFHLIMPSRATQQEFIQRYRVLPERTTVVYPGIDLTRFGSMPSRSLARRILGITDDVPIILYIGFSTPRKGLEYLAHAFRMLDEPAQLVMVGKWEGQYQRRFEQALGSALSRTTITGYVPDAQVLNYFAAADVFVLPTLLEGFGIPIVEAMAAGLPVITTTGGSAGEVVGGAGITVTPGDATALQQALLCVLADPELSSQLRQSGLDRAAELFDRRKTIEVVEEVFRRFIHARKDIPGESSRTA